VVFYLPLSRGIEVVRVLHGSRDIESIFENERNWPDRDF
jgi:plasmid stabilization system protein ParE